MFLLAVALENLLDSTAV